MQFFLGNLKFDINIPKVVENYKNELLEITKNRKVLFCSWTLNGEEEKLLKLYQFLKNDFKNLLFIIAIRHSNRTNEVLNIFNNYNESVTIKKEKINDNTDFYLYNEIGNIGTFYSAFKIVLMCGPLCDIIGGHTPIESAKFGSCILTGPYIKNNKSLYL